MRHRALDYDPATPVAELGLAALDDLLDRGDMDDWAPLLREVRRDPWGQVADRVLHLVESHPMAGTSTLWREWISEQRRGQAAKEATSPGTGAGAALRRLREAQGLTQKDLAQRLGTSQPEVSKIERRQDVRLSTMRAYITALGAELRLVAHFPEGERDVD